MTGKKINRGYSKATQEKIESKIRDLIGKNHNDDEIMEALNLQPHVFRYYRQRIYRLDRFAVEHMTAESILLDYAEQGKRSVDELEDAIRAMRKQRTPPLALVQAVKLRHRIENQIIGQAQNLGLLTNRADRLELGDLMFRKRTMKEIQAAVEQDAEDMLRELEA